MRQDEFEALLQQETKIAGHDFSQLSLHERKIDGLFFEQDSFKEMTFNRVIFADCMFVQCSLSKIKAQEISFVRCSFISCSFWDSDVNRGLFSDCEFLQCGWNHQFFKNCRLEKNTFSDNKERIVMNNFEDDVSFFQGKECLGFLFDNNVRYLEIFLSDRVNCYSLEFNHVKDYHFDRFVTRNILQGIKLVHQSQQEDDNLHHEFPLLQNYALADGKHQVFHLRSEVGCHGVVVCQVVNTV
ncbi:MAG: hypothetical protein IKI22_05140 [Neisseriaceae bacterium]|nr:hypothetical protein [Neisseriaceae bacterium]